MLISSVLTNDHDITWFRVLLLNLLPIASQFHFLSPYLPIELCTYFLVSIPYMAMKRIFWSYDRGHNSQWCEQYQCTREAQCPPPPPSKEDLTCMCGVALANFVAVRAGFVQPTELFRSFRDPNLDPILSRITPGRAGAPDEESMTLHWTSYGPGDPTHTTPPPPRDLNMRLSWKFLAMSIFMTGRQNVCPFWYE